MDWTKNWGTITKGFNTSVQATRERLGQVEPDEITELPQEYKDLEARVDQLRTAHLGFLKVSNVYNTEAYDYPVHIQESLADFGSTLGASFSSLAAQFPAAKSPTSPTAPVSGSAQQPAPKAQPHKTLPHALSRASAASASLLPPPSKLADALNQFSTGWGAVADARVEHDQVVRQRFLQPWQTTLNTTIAVAMKARQAVKASRLELDAAKQTLKSSTPAKQEHARLQVENAEDDLVQKTEVAITLMKTVLDNPEPIKNLNELVRAQAEYFARATEALQSAQGEIEELSVQAEGEYRKSREH